MNTNFFLRFTPIIYHTQTFIWNILGIYICDFCDYNSRCFFSNPFCQIEDTVFLPPSFLTLRKIYYFSCVIQIHECLRKIEVKIALNLRCTISLFPVQRAEKRPVGGAESCLDCSLSSSCPYSATKIYLANPVKQ